jgi:hypothetical protein
VSVEFDYKTLAIALFWLGVMVWLIKWIGRTLMEVSGGTPKPQRRETTEARLEQLFMQSGAASYLAAQRGGGDSQTDAARMAQHELNVVAQETALRAAAAAPIAPGATPALPNVGRMTGVAVLIHCPVCGEPVSEVPVPLPFAVECPGCHRRLNARGDGPQRMSIVVTETRKTISS